MFSLYLLPEFREEFFSSTVMEFVFISRRYTNKLLNVYTVTMLLSSIRKHTE